MDVETRSIAVLDDPEPFVVRATLGEPGYQHRDGATLPGGQTGIGDPIALDCGSSADAEVTLIVSAQAVAETAPSASAADPPETDTSLNPGDNDHTDGPAAYPGAGSPSRRVPRSTPFSSSARMSSSTSVWCPSVRGLHPEGKGR